jgi:EmrB/QacA subfamily drug resistance transporter
MVNDSYKATGRQERLWIIVAALLALLLGAMDALVMTAAMPTIVAELGNLHLYAWVYSAYFLARAISLPIIGKLSDSYGTKGIFLIAISVFLLASLAAGAAQSMMFLIVSRVFQGMGAGGIFALVYIVLSDVSPPAERGRTLSFASSIWGIASIIGPTLGGLIVTYFSWRWIFFMNVPLALLSLWGIGRYLKKKPRRQREVHIDYAGVVSLSVFILCFLTIFIVGGRDCDWLSPEITVLSLLSLVFAVIFYRAEKRAEDPVIDPAFFSRRNFAWGNIATFFSSFAIFSLFAYAPLYIQGALGRTPMQVGGAMLALSLGWSCGSLFLGRYSSDAGGKAAAVWGGLLLVGSSCGVLLFSIETPLAVWLPAFFTVGLGMGFVTLSTLLLVQASLCTSSLGVATSLHQFARTLGGTMGVGICGGVVTTRLIDKLRESAVSIPASVMEKLTDSMENIFKPEFQELLTPAAGAVLHNTVADSVTAVYWIVLLASLACLLSTLLLRAKE